MQTAMTQKILYLNIPGQERNNLTGSFTKGDHHLARRKNIIKDMRKGESTAYILGSKSILVLLDHEV